MRDPTIATVQFSVGNPGEFRSFDEVSRYIQQLEQKVSASITLLALGHLEVTFVAPEKPRRGDIRYADGTSWNPGGGEGIYFRNGAGAWVKL